MVATYVFFSFILFLLAMRLDQVETQAFTFFTLVTKQQYSLLFEVKLVKVVINLLHVKNCNFLFSFLAE